MYDKRLWPATLAVYSLALTSLQGATRLPIQILWLMSGMVQRGVVASWELDRGPRLHMRIR